MRMDLLLLMIRKKKFLLHRLPRNDVSEISIIVIKILAIVIIMWGKIKKIVKENKIKILAGVSFATAGYFLIKYLDNSG